MLLRPDGISKDNFLSLEEEAEHLFDPLYRLAIKLQDRHANLVNSYAFLPIAAEIYMCHPKTDPAKGANTESERCRRSERWPADFAHWLEREGGADMPIQADPSVLWTIFKRDFDKRAGKVFLLIAGLTDEKPMCTAKWDMLNQKVFRSS